MKRIRGIFLICIPILASPLSAQAHLLKAFSGPDGARPLGSLILSGPTLFGMTSYGGSYNTGTIFKIEVDGSGYSVLHEFSPSEGEGINPSGTLSISESTLFGVTPLGGTFGQGTVFKMSTDGSGFNTIRNFTGEANDGGAPQKCLLLIGSTLFGMTTSGGNHGFGVIYRMEKDGGGFVILHDFTGADSDGANPEGGLLLVDGALFGMTSRGGAFDSGVLFKIGTDGSEYSILHHFSREIGNGAHPRGSLILSGDTLYAMTNKGGYFGKGTVFKIQTNGTGFKNLYAFGTQGFFDGCFPNGDLLLCGDMLYGMTDLGGSYMGGVFFRIKTDGSEYLILNHFDNLDEIGEIPSGALLNIEQVFYGMISEGGLNQNGSIFSFNLSKRAMSADLVEGWNWVSFNILPEDASLDSVFSGILPYIDQVKTQTQSAIYDNGLWLGDLADMSEIKSGEMYKIRVKSACTIQLSGIQVARGTPISLQRGWNWVGFLPDTQLGLAECMNGLTLFAEQVKSQHQSAVYLSGNWIGDLVTMYPGKGYTIFVNYECNLVYPSR